MKRLASFISFLLHPVFTNSIGIVIIILNSQHFSIYSNYKSLIYLIAINLIITTLLPLICLMILMRINLISNFFLEKKKERLMMLAIVLIFNFVFYKSLLSVNISEVYIKFELGVLLSLFISIIITSFWKISLHSISWGYLTGFLLVISVHNVINLLVIQTFILASGLVATSRLLLKAHSINQVVIGLEVGVIIPFLVSYFLVS